MTRIARFPNVEVERARDPGAVARHIAGILALPGSKRIALSGGTTPPKVFQALSSHGVRWDGASVCPTDERQVPQDHPASNAGMLRSHLADQGASISALRAGSCVEPFDLVWVGMGDDGHVASLFPKMTISGDRAFPCVIETAPIPLPKEAPFARLTLNLAALVATRQMLLVVSGAAKRRLIQEVIVSQPDLPVTRLLRAVPCPVSIYALD